MNAPEKLFLPDIQAQEDSRGVPIQQVGIKGVRYPVTVLMADGSAMPSVARFDMNVALAARDKGTHMSRFIALLESGLQPMSASALADLLEAQLISLDAQRGEIHASLPVFIRKQAPVSGVSSLLDVDARFSASGSRGVGKTLTLRVDVPVTSLCPCSREISAYGAHNQRSCLSVSATLQAGADGPGVEALVRVAEQAASCEIYGLLKRQDEKFVTERAYDNPRFVEDLVRDVALALAADSRIVRYTVESENFESIHNHSAYARIEGMR